MRPTVRRRLAVAAAALLALAAAPAIDGSLVAGPTDGGAATDAVEANNSSTNVEWVTQLRYPELNGDEANVDEQGGTDVEIGSLTVLDEQGAPVERDYAFAGTYLNGLQVVDVTDPSRPVLVATYGCNVRQGDIQVMTRPDLRDPDGLARTFVTYAIDNSAGAGQQSPCFTDLAVTNPRANIAALGNSGGGSLIIEVTEPAAPVTVGFVPADGGTHNGTLQGFDTDEDGTLDEWLFYNAENDAGGALGIWDVTDPTDVTEVNSLPIDNGGTDTHDVTFSADGTRAYVASINSSYILDTTEPRTPELVSRIIDPANGIHHQADPLTVGDSTFLIISDEVAGAAGNGYCPGGGLHVWDVTVEEAPVKVGAYFMPDIAINEGANTGAAGAVTSCTSHVFRLYADQGIMTIGNMAGGIRILDVTELVGLSVGHDNTSTGQVAGISDLGWWRFTGTGEDGSDSWTFKAHPERFEEDGSFYGFSNDQTRGFEVYRFDGAAEVATPRAEQQAEHGRMVGVEQAQARWDALDLRSDALLYSCRFPTGIGGVAGLGPADARG